MRSSLLFWLVNQIISILLNKEDHLVTSIAWTYPYVCNICKKGQIQHNGNKVSPVVITSFQAQETIKAAAKVKDEKYNEIEYLDLIAKEFKMHDHCRKIFLRGFSEKQRQPRSWRTRSNLH